MIKKKAILGHILTPTGLHLAQNFIVRQGYNKPAVHKAVYQKFMSGLMNQHYNTKKGVGVIGAASSFIPEATAITDHAYHLGHQARQALGKHINLENISARDMVKFRRLMRGNFSAIRDTDFMNKYKGIIQHIIPGYNDELHNILVDKYNQLDHSKLLKKFKDIYDRNPLTNEFVRGVSNQIGKTKLRQEVNPKAVKAINTIMPEMGLNALSIADPITAGINRVKMIMTDPDPSALDKFPLLPMLKPIKNKMNELFVQRPLKKSWEEGLHHGRVYNTHEHPLPEFKARVINPLSAHATQLAGEYGKAIHDSRTGTKLYNKIKDKLS